MLFSFSAASGRPDVMSCWMTVAQAGPGPLIPSELRIISTWRVASLYARGQSRQAWQNKLFSDKPDLDMQAPLITGHAQQRAIMACRLQVQPQADSSDEGLRRTA
jgi:hypothetical protein